MNYQIEDIAIEKNNTPKKNNSFLKIFIIIILAILFFIGYKYFFLKDKSEKENFLDALSKINVNLFLDNEIYQNIFSKLEEQDYTMQTSLNFSSNVYNNQISNFDLGDLNVEVESIKNQNKYKQNIVLKYEDNDLSKATIINTEDKIGIYASDFYDKYVVLNNQNLKMFFKKINLYSPKEKYDAQKSKVNEILNYYTNIDFVSIKNDFKGYIENLSDDNFSKKKGKIKLIKENLDEVVVEGYSANISKEITQKYYNILVIDDVKDILQKYVNLEDIFNNDLNVTLYVNRNAIEKIVIQITEKDSIDIEFETLEINKRKIYFTYINSENYSGIKFEFTRSKSNAYTNSVLNLNIIENQEIKEKYSFDLLTKATLTSQICINELSIKKVCKDGETLVNFSNKLNFDDIKQIEDFNTENSYRIDEVSPEDFRAFFDEVNSKITLFYSQIKKNMIMINNSSKDLFDFLDTKNLFQFSCNVSDKIISKEEAIEALVRNISQKLTEAEEKGTTYSINDLSNLQIDGYDILVVIDENTAHILIDNLNFALDSNFNLSFID